MMGSRRRAPNHLAPLAGRGRNSRVANFGGTLSESRCRDSPSPQPSPRKSGARERWHPTTPPQAARKRGEVKRRRPESTSRHHALEQIGNRVAVAAHGADMVGHAAAGHALVVVAAEGVVQRDMGDARLLPEAEFL